LSAATFSARRSAYRDPVCLYPHLSLAGRDHSRDRLFLARLGRLLYQAVSLFDVPLIVGNVVILAYLLVFSVFLLDIVYALLDPARQVGGERRL